MERKMRTPGQWTLNDLNSLVGEQESQVIDFKDSSALNRSKNPQGEIAKDVSAMANAVGGTIVYGVVENPKTKLAERLDDGVADPLITTEWLQQIITSNIQPKLTGVDIQRIVMQGGGSAYVISVPQAQHSAPHQNTVDRKYHIRRTTTTDQLLDYEIRDLMRRGHDTRTYLKYTARRSRPASLEVHHSHIQCQHCSCTFRDA